MSDTFETNHEKLIDTIEILTRDSTRNAVKFELVRDLFSNLCMHTHVILMLRDKDHTTNSWKTCTSFYCRINQEILGKINEM